MLMKVAYRSQAKVREGTHCQRHLRLPQALDECVVLERSVAMIEPLHPQQIERLAHVLRRTFLSSMRHEAQSACTRGGEYPRELGGGMTHLGRIESHAGQVFEPGLRVVERFQRIRLGQIAQEAQDQLCL